MITGRLFGVGVGPGDPELLTYKAVRLIRAAPVIAYVSASGRPSIARQIVAGQLQPGQREVKLTLPMHPSPEIAASAYDEGSARISMELEQGRDVVVLCEGDPLFYGSFGHLYQRLGGRYPTEIVPGVPSVMAAAAAARRPLVMYSDTIVVLPATLPEERLAERLQLVEAAAIMKLGRHLAKVRRVLEQEGLLEQAVYVERVSTPDERVVPMVDLEDTEAPYFALILVGRNHR